MREAEWLWCDFKKEYKEFSLPKSTPQIVTVPKANYIAACGQGDPNEKGGAYKAAVSVLYAVALMDVYLRENGYENDLSDTCKVAPEKWKTVIRHPLRKI